jgi:hypothetical protein
MLATEDQNRALEHQNREISRQNDLSELSAGLITKEQYVQKWGITPPSSSSSFESYINIEFF